MQATFSHVNLIAKDWRALADFYIQVFGCTEKKPERDLKGTWVDELTDIQGAHIRGIHLSLPGYAGKGPTLEIFQYEENRTNDGKAINLEGFGHIAFAVRNVEESVRQLLLQGGSLLGKVIQADIDGVGRIEVAYARDPERNIIELQRWE